MPDPEPMRRDLWRGPIYRDGQQVKQVFSDQAGLDIEFCAERLRRERTGIHANIAIWQGPDEEGVKALLASDTFNIERSEERTRLANKAYSRLGDIAQQLFGEKPREYFATCLDTFCVQAWTTFLGSEKAKLTRPTEDDERDLDFVVRPYLLDGGGTIVFAPPGRGKSWVSLYLGVAVDAGLSQLFAVSKRRVLFVNLERSEKSVRRRLRQVNRALSLPADRPLLMIHARGRSLADIYEAVDESIRESGVEVLFLDSLTRGGYGDLVDNRAANSAVDDLSRLCPTWLAIAHTPRKDESHVYGSQMFDAGADILVQLLTQRRERALGVGLQITKANDVPPQRIQVVALRFDDRSRLVEVAKARLSEFPEVAAGKRLSVEEEVKEYLLEYGWSQAEEIAKATGHARSTISSLCHSAPWAERRKDGRTVYFGAKDGVS